MNIMGARDGGGLEILPVEMRLVPRAFDNPSRKTDYTRFDHTCEWR